MIGPSVAPLYPAGTSSVSPDFLVVCTITVAGTARDCTAHGPGSDTALGPAGVAWMQAQHFQPMMVRGQPYESQYGGEVPFEPRYVAGGGDIYVPERLLSQDFKMLKLVTLSHRLREGKARIGCAIDIDGLTHDCVLESQSGDPAVAREALAAMQQTVYFPAMRNGQAVPVAHHASDFNIHND